MKVKSGFSLASIQELAKTHYGLVADANPLAGYEDLNFQLRTADGQQYVLKIASAGTERERLDMQNALLNHLEKQAIGVQFPWVKAALDGQQLLQISVPAGGARWLRLLHWVPGQLWVDHQPHSPALIRRLGRALGLLCQALSDFDHPAAHRPEPWDVLQLSLTAPLAEVLNEEQMELYRYFAALYEQKVIPVLPHLRKQVIYNDANDYNILLDNSEETAHILGFIDFGDAVHTASICELAIAAAYVCMHKPRPMDAACQLVEGFHQVMPLQEQELEVLFPLIAARLLISMCSSSKGLQEDPENDYLRVSAAPGLRLLHQLKSYAPQLAHYRFRAVCGYEPCPRKTSFHDWLATKPRLHSIVDWELKQVPKHIFDLSVGSLELGILPNYADSNRFEAHLNTVMAEQKVEVAIGKYQELRPLYTSDNFAVEGNEGPMWRTLHIGLDIFAKAGTPVYAPLDGQVFSVQDNAGDRDYGPTLILEHQLEDDFRLYTLYGHLDEEVLRQMKKGAPVPAGARIARIGARPGNGDWPPHLHFQVMLDSLGMEGDFPGVAFPHEAAVWTSICPDPNLLIGMPEDELKQQRMARQDMLQARKKQLAPNLSLSYERPLKMVRGFGTYLYNEAGQRFLDTVNNVPHVGHQHPRVVAAAARQQAVLNTNTRYLHEKILQYTEQLLACFPAELAVCFLVNSGSEANELALRIAQNWKGRKDLLVLEHGYHGNTNACVEISGYKFDGPGGQGAAEHIHKLSIPDPFRGLYRGATAENGRRYARAAQDIMERLAAEGRGVAAFVGESILSCGGQIVPPPDYFRALYATVRAAGGLCIADEVQTGFGRVGSHFWAFEQHGVIPDIVTMGKPIGNGHPLGAIVCRRELAEAFANGMEYFNTFGGNPVSCAIGMEVLNVVKEEHLQANAAQQGNYLIQGLKQLQKAYPIIGDVRGSGLFLGFELVTENLVPLARPTTYLANRMREKGILMSTDGPDHNVIKIKPPLCFQQEQADFFLAELSKVFREDFMQRGAYS
ncbi:MAG: aminotransferase class III-fold pyridoxal phosphate-dependent enzyme [Bacteroidota bacterium]